MKKTILYSLAALAACSLASCSGDYDDWASPQAYSAEEAAAKYGVSFAAGPEANVTMPDADGQVQLVAISSSNSNVTGYTVKSVTINGEAIDATVEDGVLSVSAADLLAIVESQNDSRAAVARSFDVKSTVSANLANGDAVTVDVAGETTGSLTPYATPAVDAKGYYLLGNFSENGSGWDLSAPVWMTDNGDGTYTATVNTTGDGDNWYKFYCGSQYDAANPQWDAVNTTQMGCASDGDNSLHNFLVYTGDAEYGEVKTPVIHGKGQFQVTLDMNNLTYTVKRAEARYYIVGTINNPTWNADASLHNMFYAHGDNVYSYTTRWSAAWDLKFWDANNVGNWDVVWGAGNGDGSPAGNLTNTNSGAFQAPSAGYYTLTINMNDQTYTWTAVEPSAEYTSVSLIGDFNGWGGDIDLTQETNAPHNWYGRATIPSDGGLKFRANHGWDVSWGTSSDDKATAIGDVYYLGLGSENITVPAGTYDFYLNDITGRWSIVPVN